jgi:hypothetical protein
MNVRESGSSQHSIPSTLPTVGDCRCKHTTHIPCEHKIQYMCMTTSTIVYVRSTGARQGLTLKEEPATGLMVRMSRFGGGWNGCRMDMQPTVDSSCSMMAAPSPSRPLAGPLATLSAGRTSCKIHQKGLQVLLSQCDNRITDSPGGLQIGRSQYGIQRQYEKWEVEECAHEWSSMCGQDAHILRMDLVRGHYVRVGIIVACVGRAAFKACPRLTLCASTQTLRKSATQC